jgi:hypothetical protein
MKTPSDPVTGSRSILATGKTPLATGVAPYKTAAMEQTPVAQEVAKIAPSCPLQDPCSIQVPLIVGLIPMFVGSTLQDDIATSTDVWESRDTTIWAWRPE